MLSATKILNFIGYRIVNVGTFFNVLALDMDNIHHLPKEGWLKFKREDPYDQLRVTYPLSKDSLVIDVGGFTGDWAMRMYCLYSCFIDVYEPHPELSSQCMLNFRGNSKVNTYAAGLGGETGMLSFYGDNMNASVYKKDTQAVIHVPIQKTSTLFNKKYSNKQIDLLKINIEGSEYDMLPDLIANYDMKKITDIQIQFHNCVPNFAEKRAQITEDLSKTHKMVWNHDYIFESWTLK
jgi:FkbM family methyltransferase